MPAPTVSRPGVRAILTYHSIDPSGSVISLDEETFDRHVRFFSSGRVRVLPLAQLVDDDQEGDAVALTFDDGFANFATAAWPRLRAHGLPATVFVVSGRAGRDNRWDGRDDRRAPTMALLDGDQLARLSAEGAEIGSHSRTHPRLDRTAGRALVDEIAGSCDDISQLVGRRPTSFCYPFGALDDACVAAVADTYRHACTTDLAVLGAGRDPHRLPRLDCFYLRRPGLLEEWGSTRFQARLGVRRLLRSARQTASRVAQGSTKRDAP